MTGMGSATFSAISLENWGTVVDNVAECLDNLLYNVVASTHTLAHVALARHLEENVRLSHHRHCRGFRQLA